ncbi:MAG: (2Fe-2S)-binding protein [Ignavibacteriales bacterium]
MRVVDHPILGTAVPGKVVRIVVDGKTIEAIEGEPIAAALLANGIRVCRTTTKLGESRGLFCGIGRCTDCVMVVDGQPNVRTCVTAVRDGMVVQSQAGTGESGSAASVKGG